MRKLLMAVAFALAALPFLSTPGHATVISGTATFADNGPYFNLLNVTGTADNSQITNLGLSLNTPVTLDKFLTITMTYPSYFFTGQTDQISTTFDFTLPTAATGTISGTGEVVGNFFSTTGIITWNGPITVDFTDGAVLSINLTGTSVDPHFVTQQTVYSNAVLTLTSDPTTAVPEPGSLALLGTGLLGLCLVARRRRRT